MRLIQPELLDDVVASLSQTSEWPHYASFVYVAGRYNCVCIGQTQYTHGGLLSIIRKEVESPGNVFQFSNEDIFLGSLEWEDDGSCHIVETGPNPMSEQDLNMLSTLVKNRTGG